MKPIFRAPIATLALTAGLAFAWVAPVFPQDPAKPAKVPAVQKVVTKRTPADSGAIMFHEYCAPCHGVSGQGNGPAAPALRSQPANLTLLARKNGGTFPSKHFEEVLRYGVQLPAHGSSDMPVWGPTLRAISGDSDVVTLRIANLGRYVQGLQVK